MEFAHLINIYDGEYRNNFIQYQTMAAMENAADFAGLSGMRVGLYAAKFKEDFIKPNLGFEEMILPNRSTITELANFEQKLPFISDIFNLFHDIPNVRYFIYSNADIIVNLDFYVRLRKLLEKREGATILRKDILDDGTLKDHPGYDCFAFHSDFLKNINLPDVFLGYPPVGNVMWDNIRGAISPRYKIFRDENLTYHIGAEKQWTKSPYVKINKKLAGEKYDH